MHSEHKYAESAIFDILVTEMVIFFIHVICIYKKYYL